MSINIYRGLMIPATLILLAAFFIYSAYAYNLITFPYDYDQGEGFELVDTILFSQFEWPYQDTEQYPFYSSNYPPLFHVIGAPFVWFFGNSYWHGRLLGYVGTLLTAALIAYAVFRSEKNFWVAALSALAFLSSNTVYHIGPLLRQHMTMVLFETLAIVILAEAYPAKQHKKIGIGLLLLVAAGYTKQLAAISAIAALVWMMLRNPKRGILWSMSFVFIGGTIFLWLTIATNGEWWRQAIVANINTFNPYQTFGLTLLWLRLHAALIIPAVLFVVYETYFDRISLFSLWFVFSGLLGAISSGTWGAGDSYFATVIAATCITSGIFFSRTIHGGWGFLSTRSASRLIIVIPILYMVYGISTFKMPTEGKFWGPAAETLHIKANVLGRHYDSATYGVTGYANIGHFVTDADHQAGAYIVEQIQSTEGLVLSEEAGFVLAAKRDVITNPTQLRNLWLAGLWQGEQLLNLLENQEFGLLITRAQFYPVPVLEAFGAYYQIQETVSMNGFEYWLWEPVEE